MVEISKILVRANNSLREAIACIDQNAKGIALVVDKEDHLVGTVTDGDIRRAILAGMDLDLPLQALMEQRVSLSYRGPVTAPAGTSDPELIRMMNEYGLHHIPIVDENGRVVDLASLDDLVKEYEIPLRAVVMAGGYGTRLHPLTEELPKPMLPVGDRPLLEWIIQQLSQAGIRRVNLTTHFKGDVIAQHFGNGQKFGVEICYVEESQPLGTAGALSLIESPTDPLLVINGDILTRVDFRAMADFHREQQADMTVAVKEHEFHVPYGVVDTNGVRITGISEKPVVRHFINAGIYLLNPEVCRSIPKGRPYDMPQLIRQLVMDKRRVVSFLVREYWLDIGKAEDYKQALADIKSGKV